jgi:hypothetical protein
MAQSQRHYGTASQADVIDRLNDITVDQGVRTRNQAQDHNTVLRESFVANTGHEGDSTKHDRGWRYDVRNFTLA